MPGILNETLSLCIKFTLCVQASGFQNHLCLSLGSSQIRQEASVLIVDSKLQKAKHGKLKLEKLVSFSAIFNFLHKHRHNQCLGSACDG